MCETEPPEDEVRVSVLTEYISEAFGCIHSMMYGQEKPRGEKKPCGESLRENLIMKTYWDWRQQGNQMIKNLLRAKTAGESDNTDGRGREKRGIKLCFTHTHNHRERHTPRWPEDTSHTEKPAGCSRPRQTGWRLFTKYVNLRYAKRFVRHRVKHKEWHVEQ